VRLKPLIFFCVLFMTVCGAAPAFAAELEIFAGSASKPATEELARLFEAETGHGVKLFLGSSGNMLSQVKIARRGDIYFPGSPDYMERAKRDGLILEETERIVAYLIPAINVAGGNPKGIRRLDDLAREDIRVAIASPHHVCVGLYAVEILEKAGLRDGIGANIIGHTESCAKTANMVALGAADAVMGWRVFESWNPDRIETVPISPDRLPRIGYIPIAVTTLCENVQAAERFIELACSERGRLIFEKWGYITSEKDARRHAPDARIGGEYIIPEGW
jgi:molybdate transport system substrate-binding protein